ncbi:hypothetical protein B0H11DRAFT_2247762 [Mycena galericulata]|nr:hypothetical protein B0H11DRAFT_2247762 [Mycena galericulata]
MSSSNHCRALVLYQPPATISRETAPPVKTYTVLPGLSFFPVMYKTPTPGRADLQKGECYVQMDFPAVTLSNSTVNENFFKSLLYIVYDITCQWRRREGRTDGEGVERSWLVESTSGIYRDGIVHTDAEPLENAWATNNPLFGAGKVREMGPGKRHASL